MEEYLNLELRKSIATNLSISLNQVDVVLGLLKEGNTVPFIARYRKELTGALDEEKIREISQSFEYGEALAKRKEAVIRLIDEKGMLTDELKAKIEQSSKLVEIEDLYRPFKEKKKTKATEAIALGLEPLAKELMAFPTMGNLNNIVSKYLNEKVDYDKAITGAKYIIAEMVSDNASYRKMLRTECMRNGSITSKIKKNAVDENKVFEIYYDYTLDLKKIKPHTVLAYNRGEDLGFLNVGIAVNDANMVSLLETKVIKNQSSFATNLVKEAIADSYKRLIFPSIEREIRSEMTEKAEENAINIFSVNLRNLLLTPPMKGKIVLGVDPAFRTGCKIAVVDKTGKVLDKGILYQNQKFEGEKVPEYRINEAIKLVEDLIKKYDIEIVAIGNGTASRETEEFIASVLKTVENKVFYSIVNEAGASVYSASPLAKEEFPTYDVAERSAVSIARRLQDPLSELVKIDPKSIGVGQYQHDVSQNKLSDSLDFVVSTAVNQVGVNVNTASKSLLGYVSGINKGIADNIIKYREENGEFKNRSEIKKVPKLGPKAFEQSIGFLRILDGKEVLDGTSIHPESYDVAKKIMKELGIKEFGSEETKQKVSKANVDDLVKELGVDKYTITDILDAFVAPMRDPRDELDKPLLRAEALNLEDLKPGMELQGVVRNVVDFGAFVDCGMHEDGLVHISKISKNYIKHPLDVLNVGDVVKVWVLSVDLIKHKVALTMVPDKI